MVEFSVAMAQPIPPSHPPPAHLCKPSVFLERVLLCQTVGRLSWEGAHFAPHPLYFWSDGSLGVHSEDHHGWWKETEKVELIVSYNYRGAQPGSRSFPEVSYLPIAWSSSYLINPDHFVGTDPGRVTTVLVPGDDCLFMPYFESTSPPAKRQKVIGARKS